MCDWSENKGIAKVAAVCLLSARGNWKGNEATKATVGEKSEAAEAPRDPGAIVGGVGGWMLYYLYHWWIEDGGWWMLYYTTGG